MAQVIRREIRRRGLIGKIIKWTFIVFNFLMLFFLLKACSVGGEAMQNMQDHAAQTGAAIGTGIAGVMILFVWMLGTVILGALTFFTRGPLEIVEEERA